MLAPQSHIYKLLLYLECALIEFPPDLFPPDLECTLPPDLFLPDLQCTLLGGHGKQPA